MITIKELAAEFNVSKTAIRNYMTDEFREKFTETNEKGIILINDEGVKLLEHLRKDSANSENDGCNVSENFAESKALLEVLELLKMQLIEKDKQINEKDKQLIEKDNQISALTSTIETNAKTLAASQALNAADKQQLLLLQQKIEQPYSFFERLKFLFTGKK